MHPIAKPESLSTEQLLGVLGDTIEHGAYPKEYALRCLVVLATDLGLEDLPACLPLVADERQKPGGER